MRESQSCCDRLIAFKVFTAFIQHYFAQLIDYSGIFAKSYCSTRHKIELSQLVSTGTLPSKLGIACCHCHYFRLDLNQDCLNYHEKSNTAISLSLSRIIAGRTTPRIKKPTPTLFNQSLIKKSCWESLLNHSVEMKLSSKISNLCLSTCVQWCSLCVQLQWLIGWNAAPHQIQAAACPGFSQPSLQSFYFSPAALTHFITGSMPSKQGAFTPHTNCSYNWRM